MLDDLSGDEAWIVDLVGAHDVQPKLQRVDGGLDQMAEEHVRVLALSAVVLADWRYVEARVLKVTGRRRSDGRATHTLSTIGSCSPGQQRSASRLLIENMLEAQHALGTRDGA